MEQFLNFFITAAYAESSIGSPQSGGFSFVMMLLIFFLFIYFAVWRPQNKRAKEQQNLLNSLAKGDEVMTAGGMLGRISKLSDQYMSLTIAPNVEITMQKSAVMTILPKGTLKSLEQ